MKSTLPNLPVRLNFNPCEVKDLQAVFTNPTAWRLWLLWKPRHLTGPRFNDACLYLAGIIDARKPFTLIDFKLIVPRFSDDFPQADWWEFAEEALPFFNEPREVSYIMITA